MYSELLVEIKSKKKTSLKVVKMAIVTVKY